MGFYDFLLGLTFCLFVWFGFFETGFHCIFKAFPRTSSCRPGWPRIHRDLPASASRVLGLKACATIAQLGFNFLPDPITSKLWHMDAVLKTSPY